MKQSALFFALAVFLLSSCHSSGTYKPNGLRKLSGQEILQRIQAGKRVGEGVSFKDSLGNALSLEDIRKMDQEGFFGDQYVDRDGEVVEIVVRRATEKDKALIKAINEFLTEGVSVTTIAVDCSQVWEMLEAVYEADQNSRQEGGVPDPAVDERNQQIVVSILEQCCFPTLAEHGSKSVEAVFLVVQHAGKGLREKYFPLVKKSAEEGALQRSAVALMEDRMLMDKGEKQKYGSQVSKENGSAEWVLHPIQDPENVNKRRAEVGLGPIEGYLKHFNIDYKVAN